MAGLFTNSNELAKELTEISEHVCEPLWQMPITEEFREAIKLPYADLNNAPSRK